MFSFDQYQESADYIAARLGPFRPEYLLILGSGLGFLAEEAQSAIAITMRISRISKHPRRRDTRDV